MPAEDRRKEPQPLTQAQLEWVVEEVETATEKAAKRGAAEGAKIERRRNRIAFLLLLAGIILVFWLGNRASDAERQAIVESGKVVAIDGCNRDYQEDVRIRDVFLTSQNLVKSRIQAGQSADPEADKAALEFYDQQLDAFKLPDCRKAEGLLTSDPDRFVPEIEPFYPSNPNAPKSIYSQGMGQLRPG